MPTDLPGPSSFPRLAACITSEALPHVDSVGEFSTLGNVIHAFLANCLQDGRDAALKAADPQHQEALEQIDLTRLPAFDPRAYAPEVSLAWSTEADEIRELGRNLTRDKARALARPGEVVGTIDVVGLTPTSGVVWDYKTGWRAVTHPTSNKQLRAYGVLASKRWKREHIQQGLIRCPPGAPPWFASDEMSGFDLTMEEDAIRDLLAERARVRALAAAEKWDELPRFVEGDHCTYCPAQDFCPTKRAGTDEYVALATQATHMRRSRLTPEMKAHAWKRIKLILQTAMRYKAVLKDMARQEPFPLDEDGDEVVGERVVIRETIVPEVARGVFEEMFGEELACALMSKCKVEVTLTKADLTAGLREFVQPLIPNGKITAMTETALNKLRAGGAISAHPEYRVEAHTPGRALLREAPRLLPEAGADLP